jgi:hypothetical protein
MATEVFSASGIQKLITYRSPHKVSFGDRVVISLACFQRLTSTASLHEGCLAPGQIRRPEARCRAGPIPAILKGSWWAKGQCRVFTASAARFLGR